MHANNEQRSGFGENIACPFEYCELRALDVYFDDVGPNAALAAERIEGALAMAGFAVGISVLYGRPGVHAAHAVMFIQENIGDIRVAHEPVDHLDVSDAVDLQVTQQGFTVRLGRFEREHAAAGSEDLAERQRDKSDVCADIEYTFLVAAGLDAEFKTAVVRPAPVSEIAEGEFARQLERTVGADLVADGVRRPAVGESCAVEVTERCPDRGEEPQRTVTQAAKCGDNAH